MRSPAEEAHHRLIDQMIARGALWSAPLVEAFRATPRQLFLPRVWHHGSSGWREVDTAAPGRDELRLIYSDRALTTRLSAESPEQPVVPISSSSQPSLMAQMLEDLALSPGLRVLEVGAGTGYNAALIAHVVGAVVAVDVDREVLAGAARHLAALPDRRVELMHGDGRQGCPERAPFDRILVTAAADDLEPAWLEQLADGGRLLAPLEVAPGLSHLVAGEVGGGVFEGRLTRPAYFMPLRDEGETGREGGGAGPVPAAETLKAVSAPWADWEDRRTRAADHGFVASVAFLGWLEGLSVAYASFPDGRATFGVGDLVRGCACWLGAREWRVTGQAGAELGRRLWQTFLDAGGPWPTEFRLRATPRGQAPAAFDPEARLAYRRQGERCAQVWELVDPRLRAG